MGLLVLFAMPASLSAKPPSSRGKAEKPAKSRAGPRMFEQMGCAACHSISKAGIAKTTPPVVKGGPDLSGVGRIMKRKVMNAWLQQRHARKGVKHPVAFAGSAKQLNTLTRWLSRSR